MNKKFGAKKTIYIGFFFWFFGMISFVLVQSTDQLYAVMIPYCLGGMAGPTLQGLISNQVPSNQQGELQGSLTSLVSLSSVIGPPIMTSIFFFFTNDEAPFVLPGAPYALAAFFMFVGFMFASRTLLKSS